MFLAYNFLSYKYKIVYSNTLFVEFFKKSTTQSVYKQTLTTVQWFFDKGVVEEWVLGNTLLDLKHGTNPLTTLATVSAGPTAAYLLMATALLL
jgi:hypothetical protein